MYQNDMPRFSWKYAKIPYFEGILAVAQLLFLNGS